MIRFPAVDAALEGFRITREQPLAVLVWVGVLFLVNMFGQAWMLSSPALQDLTAAYASAPPTTPEAAEAIMGKAQAAGPALAVFLAVSAVLNVLLYTAVLRAVLEPAKARFGYLRAGRDELWQLGLLLLIFVIWVLYSTIVSAAAALLTTFAGQAPAAIGGLMKALIWVAAVIAGVYPVVRLSLAPAMTFADGRISLFRSWAMTREQFWGLFGAYALAAVLGLLVGLLAMLVLVALAQVAGFVTNHAFDISTVATRKGAMTVESLFSPVSIVFIAIFSACYTLGFTIFSAVAPAAFRSLSDRSGAPAA